MYRYKKLLPYILRQWPGLALIMGLTAALSAVSALQPWPIKLLVDYALGDMSKPGWVVSMLEFLTLGERPTVLVVVAALSSLGIFVLNSAIDALPSDYRTAFVMHDMEGLSNPEIAATLGISLPAVKSRVHRSRLFLRHRLTQYLAPAQEQSRL